MKNLKLCPSLKTRITKTLLESLGFVRISQLNVVRMYLQLLTHKQIFQAAVYKVSSGCTRIGLGD